MPTDPTRSRSGEDMAYSSVSYGLMTSLQIEREASLRLHYRGRKDSHRFKLEGAYDLGPWQPRLALLYARGAASSGWAVQGRLRWIPSERLQLDLLADAFDASSWDSRLYTLTPNTDEVSMVQLLIIWVRGLCSEGGCAIV